MATDTPPVSRRTAVLLTLATVAAVLIVIAGAGSAVDAQGSGAYTVVFIGLAAAFVWLAPGLCLTLALGPATSPARTLLQAAGLSFVGHALMSEIMKRISGLPLSDSAHLTGVGVLTATCLWILFARARGSGPCGIRLPYVLAVAIPVIAGSLLAPWIVTENLNDDGLEALYMGESLSHHHFPRWPTESGGVGFGLGMIPVAWINHWFVAWFGAVPCSPRLPLLIALPLIFAALLELIAWKRERAPSSACQLGLAGLLLVYAVVIGRNAGYNPYFCDIASPGAVDSLFIAFMLSAFAFLVNDRIGWFLLFAALASASRPTAALLLGGMGVGCVLVSGAGRWRWLFLSGGAVVIGAVLAYLWEAVFIAGLDSGAGQSYGSRSIVQRYRYLTLLDFERLLYFIVPCGILPFVSMLFFKTQDSLSRRLTLMCGVYLGAMYVPAFISLHHYVPLMLIPAVVHWRRLEIVEGRPRRLEVAATFVCLVSALVISCPSRLVPHTEYERFGDGITVAVPKSRWQHPRHPAAVLDALIDVDGAADDPRAKFIGTPWTAWHYARHEIDADPATVTTRYLVVKADIAMPVGWSELQRKNGLVLLEKTGNPDPYPTDLDTRFASPVYRIPRDVLHRHRGELNGAFDIDVRKDILGEK